MKITQLCLKPFLNKCFQFEFNHLIQSIPQEIAGHLSGINWRDTGNELLTQLKNLLAKIKIVYLALHAEIAFGGAIGAKIAEGLKLRVDLNFLLRLGFDQTFVEEGQPVELGTAYNKLRDAIRDSLFVQEFIGISYSKLNMATNGTLSK